jgi:transcriptional regulator with XRE-family HTH domain
MQSLERLAQLKKRDNESDDDFAKRFGLTAEELARWKKEMEKHQAFPMHERLM